MKRVPVSTLVAATLLALAAARPGASGVPDTPARIPTPAPAPDPLAGPLSERISGKKGLDDVRIDVDWPRDTTPTSARIYGNGVGIWDRRLQFALSRREVISALEVLRSARFGAMPGAFGSDTEGKKVEGPLRLHGKVVLWIGPYNKRVTQMVDGDQSVELAAAAQKILDICAGPGAKGKGAASLEEGLRLVAQKRLVPEVLSVVVNRRAGPGAADAEGWILRIGGRTAVDRRMPAGQAPPLARRLVLSEADFMALVKTLSGENVATLPGNLYASAYTDLSIELLDRSHNVAARQFLNVTPETHGARQQAFDRVMAALRSLHERTQRDGKPVEELMVPPGAGSATERKKEAEREEREKARKVTPRRATSSSQEGP